MTTRIDIATRILEAMWGSAAIFKEETWKNRVQIAWEDACNLVTLAEGVEWNLPAKRETQGRVEDGATILAWPMGSPEAGPAAGRGHSGGPMPGKVPSKGPGGAGGNGRVTIVRPIFQAPLKVDTCTPLPCPRCLKAVAVARAPGITRQSECFGVVHTCPDTNSAPGDFHSKGCPTEGGAIFEWNSFVLAMGSTAPKPVTKFLVEEGPTLSSPKLLPCPLCDQTPEPLCTITLVGHSFFIEHACPKQKPSSKWTFGPHPALPLAVLDWNKNVQDHLYFPLPQPLPVHRRCPVCCEPPTVVPSGLPDQPFHVKHLTGSTCDVASVTCATLEEALKAWDAHWENLA
jgi:hypothetical protein